MYEYEQEREILIVVDHGVYSGASSTVAPARLIDETVRRGGTLKDPFGTRRTTGVEVGDGGGW
jgi:hypothetical protein